MRPQPPTACRRRAWTPSELDRQLAVAHGEGLVQRAGTDQWRLTAGGRRRAIDVVRGQRLSEAFLVEYPEQAGSVANIASGDLAERVPAATVALLTERLQAEGRWPEEAAS